MIHDAKDEAEAEEGAGIEGGGGGGIIDVLGIGVVLVGADVGIPLAAVTVTVASASSSLRTDALGPKLDPLDPVMSFKAGSFGFVLGTWLWVPSPALDRARDWGLLPWRLREEPPTPTLARLAWLVPTPPFGLGATADEGPAPPAVVRLA